MEMITVDLFSRNVYVDILPHKQTPFDFIIRQQFIALAKMPESNLIFIDSDSITLSQYIYHRLPIDICMKYILFRKQKSSV